MWLIYTNETHPESQRHGQIELIYDGTREAAESCLKPNQSIVQADADPQVHWIDISTGQRMDRAPLGATLSSDTLVADGFSEVILSGLPVPFNISINDQAVLVDNGSLEFSTDTPGEYRILCQSAQYHAERFVIYAA